MAKYNFKPSERYAVFTIHGENCYLCRKPIDMASFQVGHIIPESLVNSPNKFESVIQSYGLPNSFDVNTFENWMPACSACNNRKRDEVFEALPIFAVELKKADDKATKARALENETRSNQQVARAVTIIEVAYQKGTLTEIQNERLQLLVDFHQTHRVAEKADTPVLIGPGLELLRIDGELITVNGPYGVGVGRANPPNHGNFRCVVCGESAWNGVRCVACGTIDDD